MTHSLKELDDSKIADVIRQDYVSKLRKKQFSDSFVDPNDEQGYTPEMDEVKTRIKSNFDNFKSEFSDSISELESKFMLQYKEYMEIKRLSLKEKKALESLYKVKFTVEGIKELEERKEKLTLVFKEEHANLMKVYQDKQSELNTLIAADRQAFEMEMFKKRSDMEDELKILSKSKEKYILEQQNVRLDFEEEITLKRQEWESEKSNTEALFLQKKKEMIAEENQLKENIKSQHLIYEEQMKKNKSFYEKEESALSQKMEILQKKLTVLEEENKSLALQSQLSLDIESKKLKEQEQKFKEDMELYRDKVETELEQEKKKMMSSYQSTRDTAVDQIHDNEKQKLKSELLELSSQCDELNLILVSKDKALDDLRLKYEKRSNEINSNRKELESVRSVFDSKLEETNSELKNSLIEKFQKKLEETLEKEKKDYSQQIQTLNAEIEASKLETVKANQEVLKLQHQLKNSYSKLDQMKVDSVQNTVRQEVVAPLFDSSGNPKIIRTNRQKSAYSSPG